MDVKLSEAIAADIRERVKSLDFKTVEKIRKAKDENGSFDVIISTEDLDRAGEIVRQDGWELTNYKNNPVVLWGHDYYSLPIGVCTEIYKTEKNGLPATGARGVFYPSEINPLAQQVRRMYDMGFKTGFPVGCTTSVGFIPKEFDESNRAVITKAELLEFSFVPVPANQGVGPAAGRALTFEEAKELHLDTNLLVKKGIQFAEGKVENEAEKKEQAGDPCTMDDGSAGVFSEGEDGGLVCVPSQEDKSAEAVRDSQKKLLKDLADEHERHGNEVAEALEDFKAALASGQGEAVDETDEKAVAERVQKATSGMQKALKDLRTVLSDEHMMHRANSLKAFRAFDPTEDKAFDKAPHLKSLRGEHDGYEAKCMKALDELQSRCMKSVQDTDGQDENAEWITETLDSAETAHKRSVTKLARAMCKSAFAEEEEPDEKTVAIVKEFLAPHVPAQLLPAVASKLASKITAANREKLGEAHFQLKAATAIVETLHGALGNDEGEESRSDGEQTPAPALKKQRSRPSEDVKQDDALEVHLLVRDILRGVTTAAQEGLKTLKEQARK